MGLDSLPSLLSLFSCYVPACTFIGLLFYALSAGKLHREKTGAQTKRTIIFSQYTSQRFHSSHLSTVDVLFFVYVQLANGAVVGSFI